MGICDGHSEVHARAAFSTPSQGFPGLTGIELIAVTNPHQVTLGHIVKQREVEVAGNAMDGANANLMKAAEEVFTNVDWLTESLGPDVGHCSDAELVGSGDF